jgi:hypothetical protein
MPRTVLTALAAAGLVLGLAACGSDSESLSVPSATTPPHTQTAAPQTQTTQAAPTRTSTQPSGGGSTTSASPSGGTPAPSDSGKANPADRNHDGTVSSQEAKQTFEEYCNRNPTACGD